MKSGGRIISIGSAVGERVMTPGLVAYSATKGAVKLFTQGLSREVGSRGYHGQQRPAGPIDTDLNPAAGDWAVPQKAATALDRYGRVDEVAALWRLSPVRSPPTLPGESYGRWGNERLNRPHTVMGLKKDVSVRTWLRADDATTSALRQDFASFVLKKAIA